MKLTVTSLNLQGFEQWEDRYPFILQYLSKINPDVVLFQETVFLPAVSPYNQAQLLNQTLKYPYQVSTVSRLQSSVAHPIYREGLALISKFPIASSDTLTLKKEAGDKHSRILQLADIMVNGTILKLGNVHFSVTDHIDYATPQLEETLAIMKARHEKRILMGDFNITHLEDTKRLWGEEYSSTATSPYISYPATNKRIDYALIPNEYSLIETTVSHDGLSDHRALTVVIEIKE